MIFEYEYLVQSVTPGGDSIVEYTHPDLGSVTAYVFLPLDKPELFHQKIAEAFPVNKFYGNWLKNQGVPSPGPLRGTLSIDFSDHFYGVQDEATHTEV